MGRCYLIGLALVTLLVLPSSGFGRSASDYNRLGAKEFRQGHYEKAVLLFNKAITKKPGYMKAYNNRGNAFYKMGNYKAAIYDFNQVIASSPKYANAYLYLGLSHFLLGDYPAALKHYESYLTLNPENSYIQIFKYLAQRHSGIDGRNGLIKLSKTLDEGSWVNQIVQMLIGNITPDKCLELTYNSNSKIEKEQLCEAYFYIGEYYLLNNDKSKARECFQKCLATGFDEFAEYNGAKSALDKF